MKTGSVRPKLNRTVFPEYIVFRESCKKGLSIVYPFKTAELDDPYGWKFGGGWPPSHNAFGRMRSLLAVQDALGIKPRRVLEVAAGGGGLAATLADNGSEVSVNDLREATLIEAIGEFTTGEKINVFGGNLFDLSPIQTGKFDLVLACEVIEHVAHPSELLEHLKKFLEPDGHLLLTTPNGSYFRNKLPTFSEKSNFDELEARQFKPDADGHLFLFTPQELSDLATTVGLQIERLSVWGTPMLTGHVCLRYLAHRFLVRAAYKAEILTQRLPSAMCEHICASLSAVLRLA